MEESDNLSFCLSFNSYSSDRLAEIGAKVSEEFGGESQLNGEEEAIVHDDDDFEFSLVRDDPDASVDGIISDGQIRPVFPLFNRDLLIYHGEDREIKPVDDAASIRIPLKKLFMEEREDRQPPSSSSSEADELESVPPGTYCVWRPKAVESLPSMCKKSNSTGSVSKRWKFRDLLHRSNSDGKDSFVFLTPKHREGKSERSLDAENSKKKRNSADAVKVAGKVKPKGVAAVDNASSSAHEEFYVRNRALREGDKRKSYLPYRQDLVGFFAKVEKLGPLSKAFPPF